MKHVFRGALRVLLLVLPTLLLGVTQAQAEEKKEEEKSQEPITHEIAREKIKDRAYDKSQRAQALQGFVSEETLPGILSFRRCQGGKQVALPYLLDDLSAHRALLVGVMAVRDAQMNRDRPMYVEFQGVLGDKLVAVHRFERAIGYLENCSEALKTAPADATLFAEGMSPATWRFVVNRSGARFTLPGAKPLRFESKDFSAPRIEDGKKIYDAWSPLDGGTLHLEITEEPCLEPAAETAFGAQALLRLGHETYEGCAGRF